MNMKKISVFLALVYCLGFLVSLPYQNIVNATETIISYGMEGSVTGNGVLLSESGIFASKKMTGKIEVSTVQKHNGTKSLYTEGASTGYLNLTYSLSSYFTEIHFYAYCNIVSASSFVFYFYNNTLGRTNYIVGIRFNRQTGTTYYVNEIGNWVQYESNGNWVGTFTRAYGFKILNSTGDCSYLYDTTLWTNGACRNATAINQGYRIDRIYIDTQINFYVDDFSFYVSTSYDEGGGTEVYCGDDVSSYDMQIGDVYTVTSTYPVQTQDILGNYNVPLDTTIRAVGLVVNAVMEDWDSTLSNYSLTLNGVSIGSPLCFSDFETSTTGLKMLYWTTATTLDNEILSYVFTHTSHIGSSQYWSVGGASFDLDGDGDTIFYFNAETTTWYWDWVNIFGGLRLPMFLPHTTVNQNWNVDLGVTFWCDAPTPPAPDITYNNSLGLHNWKYQNETGYVYVYPDVLTTGIVCTYTLADQINDYHILINFSNATDNVFPYYAGDFPTGVLEYPDGSLSCVPTVEGRYDFCLYTQAVGMTFGYCDNLTAWVVGNLSDITDYYLYTNPPITNQFDLYDVHYKYDNPNSYSGAIAFFDEYEDYSDNGFNGREFYWYVEDGSEDSQSYRSTGTGEVEYWGLYADKTGDYVQVFPLVAHMIRQQGIIRNKIWTNVDSIAIFYPEVALIVIGFCRIVDIVNDVSILVNISLPEISKESVCKIHQ